MTEVEFQKIILAIRTAYPTSGFHLDKHGLDTWRAALTDLDYRVAENALWEHIHTSAWPPKIAEIREKCANRMHPMLTDWGEAWEEVQQAIRKYGSYREEEAVKSLSQMTAAAVRRMGFRNLCMSENQVADRAHFQRIYENLVQQEKRQAQLPESVKEKRNRLIEAYAQPVQQIESTTEALPLSPEERASPEHVNAIMAKLRKSMALGAGRAAGK